MKVASTWPVLMEEYLALHQLPLKGASLCFCLSVHHLVDHQGPDSGCLLAGDGILTPAQSGKETYLLVLQSDLRRLKAILRDWIVVVQCSPPSVV